VLVESEARPRREVLFASSVLFLGTGLVAKGKKINETNLAVADHESFFFVLYSFRALDSFLFKAQEITPNSTR
jgi:hypothetical protein